MVTPTSFLQTLANDEAIAFVASLHNVKAHLSQELQWMEAQVQQKMVQLQGIETLLSEAEALELVVAKTHTLTEPVVPGTPIVTDTIDVEQGGNLPVTASVTAMEAGTIVTAALPVQKPSMQPHGKQGKNDQVKASRDAKPSTSTKTSTKKAKPSTPSKPPASQPIARGKASSLQRFLKGQFRDKALTEAVSDILILAAVPLSTDAVMAELYDGLPKADYDRAKHSLANILSVGKGKGTWKSAGRGLYAARTLVID